MAGNKSLDKVRFATFNAALNRNNAGDLITDLSNPDNEQGKAVAEIIQRTNPDVLLLNEFDYDENGVAIANFQQNYLEVSQNGVDAVEYPYVYLAGSNTGIASGFDLNNDGTFGTEEGTFDLANDAFGFGTFPGQYGMVLLSKYPIVEDEVRTFQNFLWKDMPNGFLSNDPSVDNPDTDVNENLNGYYSADEIEVLRLSSKSHWDVPINVNGEIIHVLASHPTPPVFDGAEDKNGKRNHDEIRFWADYVTPGNGEYIYDDNGGTGGLNSGEKFVIMGDQNADPNDGDSTNNAILQLLDNSQINTAVTPSSEGGIDAASRQGGANATHKGNPGFDTADFADTSPGNLRVDYVLPSNDLDIIEAGVFWPESDHPQFDLVGDFPFPSSDHRLVYADVENTNVDRKTVAGVEFLGEVNFPTGLQLDETEVGGISGLAYDADKGIYYGLSDDRSEINPARFYDISIDLSDGSLDDEDITFDQVTTLLDKDGNAFPESSLDPEGIVLTKNNTFFISSEGDANQLINPFVNEFSVAGQEIGELPVPAKFNPTADQSSGIRNNAAFESLTITPDQRYLYTAVEDALFQDGPRADLDNGSLVRIVKYDLQTKEVVGEFVYELDAVAEEPEPADAFKVNGLVELLAVDNNGTLLALERSFSVGKGNTVRLYEVQTQGALDVSGENDLFREDALEDDGEILEPGVFEIDPAVNKRLLIDFEDDLGITPDNLEALAFGPTLADGSQSLIIASDNNFNDTQTTQFLALGLDFNTTPAAVPTVETPYTIDNEEVLEPKPLNILLVNDDGFEAEGIEVMYDALVAEGHNVTFVAPKEQQSGKGTFINVNQLGRPTEVVEFEENKWYVDGSPVVTTLAGLDYILNGEEPDLVISGINEGENVGASVAISSGTVSAATTATRRNIPAIAVSAGTLRDAAFNPDEAELAKAYEKGANTVVNLVKQLSVYSEDKLMPDGVGLNVNIPPVVDDIEGVSYTKLDGTGTFNLFVDELAPDVPSLLFSQGDGIEPSEITVEDSEGQNFLADFITVTPIDGNWTAGDNVRQTLESRIESAPENPAATPLNILLTNDDGFDAPGIEALYNQLTAAGHTVTLVGPKEQQSGTGTVLDVDKIFQPLDINNVEGNKWYVDAGVRTTTWAGLDYILDEQPDLVISGINGGENIGPGGAVSSGTVSAAVTALLRGIPAIAISGGVEFPTFQTPDTTYTAGAEYLVNLIAQLQATQGEDQFILPDGKGLSINIPTRFPDGVTEIQGVKFTNASDTEPFIIDFGPLDNDGNVGLKFDVAPVPTEVNETSEGDQFLSGFITVTPIDGNWTAPDSDREIAEEILTAPEPLLAGDSDDPAIWVNPNNSGESIVIGTLKDGGLAVFDLGGNIIQTVLPAPFGDIRYNNVDLIYGFDLGSEQVDLAVVSDRENDTLAIFKINPSTSQLEDITADGILETIFGVDDGEATAYGLAAYQSPVSGKSYAFVTQADGNKVAQLELVADNGKVNANVVRTLELPIPTGDAADSQSEGIVIDQELGFLYVALEEEVGILKFSAEPEGGSDFTVVQPLQEQGDLQQTPFSDFITFGDSIVDVGNVSLATGGTRPQSPPYFNGRFSNGEAISEIIAEELGLSASTPYLAGGNNYAFGGAETGSGLSEEGSPNVGEQINFYLAADAPTATDVFFIVAGANNFLPVTGAEATLENIPSPETVLEGLTDNITTLANAGAQNFIISNLAPLGSAPAFANAPEISNAFNALSTQYNTLLDSELDELEDELGINIIELDVASEVANIQANPGEFRLTNIDTVALDTTTGTVVANPDEYFWWDEFHPTVTATNLIAQAVIDDIPGGTTQFTTTNTSPLVADIEGLSIYYGDNGTGYLIANSQGDSSYAVFSREGNNEYLGSFVVGDNNGIDQVNESDGLDVTNLPLGEEFPKGLLVLQDGANDPQNAVEDEEELENNSTNFKFVPWDGVAHSFENPLQVDTTSYDPRNPEAQSLINGIASGDTTQNSTVLWARSTFEGEVTFEYSTDAEFNSVIATVTANVDNINVPVKVEIEGLTPGTQYYYRVTDAAGASAIGEFKTSAEVGNYQGFRFGATGDWQQAPPYPSLKNADDRDLDLFVKLGDTIYADLETPALPGVSQARTLDDFRTKQGEVLTSRFDLNTVPELYASTSILATIDDHEIVDNFAGGAAPGESPDAPDIGSSTEPLFTDDVEFVNDTQAYEDALQAYQEYHPIEDKFYGETGDSRTEGERKLYRYNNYGSDAAVIMLDSRSFRDAQIDPASLTDANDAGRFLAEAYDPTRTLLGRQQVEDLKADLLDAEEKGITWKFITIPEPIQNFGLLNAEDRFEGYAAERAEILQFIDDNDIDNVVFMAGDFHGTIVNNLTYQTAPGTEQIATNAFEIVTGPVAFNDGLFGPTVANLATAAGLITPEQKAFYDALPIAGDTDSELNDKDDFIKNLIVEQTTPLGYDPVGLNNNLAQAENLIDAELLQGDYVSTHTFGWTEFDIDAETQALTVTTYGIEPYSEAELLENSEAITSREPQIVSQFVVNPQEVDPLSATLIDTSNTDANGNEIELIDLRAYAGRTVTANFEINREADYDNNVYFYTVDNPNGEIDGIAPDASGYLQAALNMNNVINPTNGLTTADEQTTTGSLEIAGGDILAIAIVADGTLADANNNLDNVEGVYFSYIGANTDDGSFDHIKFENNMFKFEDLVNGGDQDFNDLEIKMDFTVV